jgi:hypothetical protein
VDELVGERVEQARDCEPHLFEHVRAEPDRRILDEKATIEKEVRSAFTDGAARRGGRYRRRGGRLIIWGVSRQAARFRISGSRWAE